MDAGRAKRQERLTHRGSNENQLDAGGMDAGGSMSPARLTYLGSKGNQFHIKGMAWKNTRHSEYWNHSNHRAVRDEREISPPGWCDNKSDEQRRSGHDHWNHRAAHDQHEVTRDQYEVTRNQYDTSDSRDDRGNHTPTHDEQACGSRDRLWNEMYRADCEQPHADREQPSGSSHSLRNDIAHVHHEQACGSRDRLWNEMSRDGQERRDYDRNQEAASDGQERSRSRGDQFYSFGFEESSMGFPNFSKKSTYGKRRYRVAADNYILQQAGDYKSSHWNGNNGGGYSKSRRPDFGQLPFMDDARQAKVPEPISAPHIPSDIRQPSPAATPAPANGPSHANVPPSLSTSNVCLPSDVSPVTPGTLVKPPPITGPQVSSTFYSDIDVDVVDFEWESE